MMNPIAKMYWSEVHGSALLAQTRKDLRIAPLVYLPVGVNISTKISKEKMLKRANTVRDLIKHDTDPQHHLLWCPRHNHYYDDKALESSAEENDGNQAGLSGTRDFIAGSCAGIASTGILYVKIIWIAFDLSLPFQTLFL